jgi:hypothetical protein
MNENNLGYEISTSVNNEIFEIILTGAIAVNCISKAFKKVYDIIGENNPEKLLVDVREVKGRYGYKEAYFQIRDYPSSFHNIKHAIVDIPEHKDYRTFYEYVAARVVGLSFKWFTDIDVARTWLKNE